MGGCSYCTVQRIVRIVLLLSPGVCARSFLVDPPLSFIGSCDRLASGSEGARQLCINYYEEQDGSTRFWRASMWRREEPSAFFCSGIHQRCLQQDVVKPQDQASYCSPLPDGVACGQDAATGICRAGFCQQANGMAISASEEIPSEPMYEGPPLVAGEVDVAVSDLQPSSDGTKADFFTVTVNPKPRKRVVLPANYLGVSLEWGRLDDYASNINAWADIFRSLGPSPVLRIGGFSQEALLLPDYYDRIDVQLSALAALRNAVGSMQFLIGLPLYYANSAANISRVASIISRAKSVLGKSVIGFELGNEPNYWPLWTTTTMGGWNLESGSWEDGFMAYVKFKKAVVARLPLGPCGSQPWFAKNMMGPGWGGVDTINSNSERYILNQSSCDMKQYTLHYYPPYNRTSFTLRHLLSENLMRTDVASLKRPVSNAAAARLRLRISESNSMYAAGLKGVSDVFGAALWTADWAFESARAGVASLQLHWGFGGHPRDGGPAYCGVQTNYVRAADGSILRSVPSVHAPWWGYLLFVRTAYPVAAGMPTSAQSTGAVVFAAIVNGTARGSAACVGGSAGGVKVWPLVQPGSSREVRIAVINKGDPEAAGGGVTCNVTIRLTNSSYGDAQLLRLHAERGHMDKSAASTSFGGQYYPWLASKPTPDVVLSETIPRMPIDPSGPTPQARVAYTFLMPPATAAILWVQP